MSDSDNAASDIAPRSAWEDAHGARVTVICTAGGYVRFLDADGVPRTLHHCAFRSAFAPIYDRRQVRSQFNVSLANLAEFTVYWDQYRRKIIARSLVCQRAFALPAGVVRVGVYGAPFSSEVFLEDLDQAIAAHERSTPQQLATAI